MARKRRRRHSRRRFGDYVSIPLGLGKMQLPSIKQFNPFGKSVRSTDIIVGAFVGLAGGAGLKYLINRFWPTAPGFIRNYITPITTIGAGAAALAVLKDKNKATGYFVGSFLAGAVPLGWGILQKQFPQFFSDYVDVNLGLMTDVAPMGLLVDEGSAALSELAAYSMGNEEAYDVPM
jgi:hypothetical protein